MKKIRSKLKTHSYPLVTIFAICITLGVAALGVIKIHDFYRSLLPDVSVLQSKYPVAQSKDEHKVVFKFYTQRPAHWRSLNEISKKAVAAVIMSEDGNFFQHKGYDPEAIRDAWEDAQKAGKFRRGASTITQQLVKNLFLSPEKTISRKIRELLLSIEIERSLSKQKILETYLNIVEWGPNIYGIENASRHYFHKAASELTAREGAILAFLLPNPKHYQRSIRDGTLSEFGINRVSTILERLWRTGQISDEEYASAWN